MNPNGWRCCNNYLEIPGKGTKDSKIASSPPASGNINVSVKSQFTWVSLHLCLSNMKKYVMTWARAQFKNDRPRSCQIKSSSWLAMTPVPPLPTKAYCYARTQVWKTHLFADSGRKKPTTFSTDIADLGSNKTPFFKANSIFSFYWARDYLSTGPS